jgi:hypothetical protein
LVNVVQYCAPAIVDVLISHEHTAHNARWEFEFSSTLHQQAIPATSHANGRVKHSENPACTAPGGELATGC